MSLLDLRLLLGMRGYGDVHRETIEEFKKRRQDHINWLTELESSVRESREFHLTLDPHKCAFGRWYDTYRTDDPILSLKLSQFDEPHQRIHALGSRVRTMVDNGMQSEATRLIDRAREQDLAALLRLFDDTLPLLLGTAREVVILVHTDLDDWDWLLTTPAKFTNSSPKTSTSYRLTRRCGLWANGSGA